MKERNQPKLHIIPEGAFSKVSSRKTIVEKCIRIVKERIITDNLIIAETPEHKMMREFLNQVLKEIIKELEGIV